MPETRNIILSWSGGKDSALTLHALRRAGGHHVVALLTTVSQEYDRISHHGVRAELLDRQAEAVGLPLHRVDLPSCDGGPCTNEQYECVMERVMLDYKAAGITTVAFGDIFLQDLREYRESKLAAVGMEAMFPLWGRDTGELVRSFIRDGFEARLCCVDGAKLGEGFAGRPLDADLIRDLPAGVDPCGERGEYHSFVYNGPIFRRPVGIAVGRTVHRDVRYFTDLLPMDGQSAASCKRNAAARTAATQGDERC